MWYGVGVGQWSQDVEHPGRSPSGASWRLDHHCAFPGFMGFRSSLGSASRPPWLGLTYPTPGGSLSCPRLTRHLCEAGQATACIVHQQYSVRTQPDASQEQRHHLLKLALLYAACRARASMPYVSRVILPISKAPNCSPSKDSSQSTAQPASATSTSSA